MKKVIPKTESGRRKGTLSQGLTRNVGYPQLREHLGASVAFMKLSRDYLDFIDKRDTHYPRFGEQYRLISTTTGTNTTARACKDKAAN